MISIPSIAYQRLNRLLAYAKLILGIYKYRLTEHRDAVALKLGKKGILGGFIAAKGHYRIIGSEKDGYGDIGICLHDFKRGTSGTKKYVSLPRQLEEFNSQDISDLCNMSKHVAEAEKSEFELTQLVRLAMRHSNHIQNSKQFCGERCIMRFNGASTQYIYL